MSARLQMGIASTSSPTVHGVGIRLVTGVGLFRWAKYNHSLIWFDNMSDDPDVPSDNGLRVYFESFVRRDPKTGKTGVRGPIPWKNLADWVAESKRHKMISQVLPYEPATVRKAYWHCKAMVGKVGYAHLQILHNIKTNVFGLGNLPWLRTPGRMTCSEFVAHVWDWVDPGRPFAPGPMRRYLEVGTRYLMDDVTPAGQQGLYEAADQFLFDYYRHHGIGDALPSADVP